MPDAKLYVVDDHHGQDKLLVVAAFCAENACRVWATYYHEDDPIEEDEEVMVKVWPIHEVSPLLGAEGHFGWPPSMIFNVSRPVPGEDITVTANLDI